MSAPENDVSEGQSHGVSELGEVDCEVEIPNNERAIAVRKISTRQEEKTSGNMKQFFYIL